jgi:hypothetical protein
VRRRAAIAIWLAFPALALAATAPGPLAGGWSFAHWGMTKAQVRAASGGLAHAPADDPGDPDDVVDGGATIDRFHFLVRLEYAASGLARVDLRLQGTAADCAALGDYLKTTYGADWSESDDEAFVTISWRGARDGDQITWTRMGDGADGCEVELDPPDAS